MATPKSQKDLSKYPLSVGERSIPHDLEAEQSLLGSMLLSDDAITTALEILDTDDFYKHSNKLIFHAIKTLFNRGEPADPITLAADLESRNELEGVGGREYLHDLLHIVPTAANARYYAEIIERNAVYRRMIAAAGEVANLGFEAPDNVQAAIDEAERVIFGVTHRTFSDSFVHIKPLLSKFFDEMQARAAHDSDVMGVPSGFRELDDYTSGFHPSDLVIIAARPGMGKTSLVLNIAEHVAIDKKIPIGIFSLEMSKEQIVQRMLSSRGRIPMELLKRGQIHEEDTFLRVSDTLDMMGESPIYIDDTPNLSVMQLRAKARRVQSKHKLGLIIIDYLQLMQGHTRDNNRYQEISEISRSLKILARELSVPVIAVSQLSREVEKRPDKRPQLSDLRESGAIEQDADLVMFIYRDEYYNKEDVQVKGEAEVIIAKQRNGPIGTVKLLFKEIYSKFDNRKK